MNRVECKSRIHESKPANPKSNQMLNDDDDNNQSINKKDHLHLHWHL